MMQQIQTEGTQRNTIAILLVSWAILYVPLYVEFSQAVWLREENAHGPFILVICLAVIAYKLYHQEEQIVVTRNDISLGGALLGLGCLQYAYGRIGEIDLLSSTSQPFVLTGLIIFNFGITTARRLAFPLAMSLFLIVWPGWIIDSITSPLKRFVSSMVSDGLFTLGFPVSHAGAVISAGQYDLLVADACAGLNSFFALCAAGFVYLYAVGSKTWRSVAFVTVSIIPIAIFANIIRVAMLVLLTIEGGYDVGQSFLHEGAGVVMFAIALVCVFGVEKLAAGRKGEQG